MFQMPRWNFKFAVLVLIHSGARGRIWSRLLLLDVDAQKSCHFLVDAKRSGHVWMLPMLVCIGKMFHFAMRSACKRDIFVFDIINIDIISNYCRCAIYGYLST